MNTESIQVEGIILSTVPDSSLESTRVQIEMDIAVLQSVHSGVVKEQRRRKALDKVSTGKPVHLKTASSKLN